MNSYIDVGRFVKMFLKNINKKDLKTVLTLIQKDSIIINVKKTSKAFV